MTNGKLHIISIFDKKTNVYGKPMPVEYLEDGLREWNDIKADTNTKYGKHPSDFELYKVGEFSVDNGEFVAGKPVQLA